MESCIELLQKLGLSTEQAISLVKEISEKAYEAGRLSGQEDEPAIVGVSLGESRLDFDDWWDTFELSDSNQFCEYYYHNQCDCIHKCEGGYLT